MTVSRVYIVNVWYSGSAQPDFRASVRAVEDLEPRFFTATDELVHFFAEAAAEPDTDRGSAATGAGDSNPHRKGI
jgi:hypothetical protein